MEIFRMNKGNRNNIFRLYRRVIEETHILEITVMISSIVLTIMLPMEMTMLLQKVD